MKIDKIQKTNSGKYKISIGDKKITTYDDVLINTGVLYKKEIDDDTIEQIELQNIYYDAYNKTISYIMKHQRSKKEIIEYLSKYELSKDDLLIPFITLEIERVSSAKKINLKIEETI